MKRSFLASQSSLLKTRPLVVGTLTRDVPLSAQLQRAKSGRADLIELRLDGFSGAYGPFQRAQEFGRNLIRDIKTKSRLPVLLTFRAASERGGAKSPAAINDARRAEILARLLPSVEMVDVEIRHRPFAHRMTVIAHIHGTDVIHSAHNFSGMGSLTALSSASQASLKLKGDVFKVAVAPATNDELEKFLRWGLALKNPDRVLIGMGAVGLISRVIGFSFGSILTYGHLGRSAAPGQMPIAELVASIRSVYPLPPGRG